MVFHASMDPWEAYPVVFICHLYDISLKKQYQLLNVVPNKIVYCCRYLPFSLFTYKSIALGYRTNYPWDNYIPFSVCCSSKCNKWVKDGLELFIIAFWSFYCPCPNNRWCFYLYDLYLDHKCLIIFPNYCHVC